LKEKIQIVTGNRGFVGVNLTEFLSRNKKQIIGVSRSPSKGDISYNNFDIEVLNNAKSCIHLAGKAHDLKKISEDKEYFEINTELTKNIFDKFLESTCETFIYMSSVKAVADVVEGALTENVTPNPVTVYGKSKLAAENYILSKEIPSNKRVYILRPCMIHGPRNKGNLNLLYSFISKGIPYPFGQYENKRSFVSVENLCFIINELIDNDSVEPGIYNVSDDESLSTNDLVKHIGKAIDKRAKILKTPKKIIDLIAKIGDVIPLPINSERLLKLTENYVVSNVKIKRAIGKQLPLSAVKGIIITIKSFI
jgi:nucleoside-diphosphate-sugar epimerase